jgi:hypothetical protein
MKFVYAYIHLAYIDNTRPQSRENQLSLPEKPDKPVFQRNKSPEPASSGGKERVDVPVLSTYLAIRGSSFPLIAGRCNLYMSLHVNMYFER